MNIGGINTYKQMESMNSARQQTPRGICAEPSDSVASEDIKAEIEAVNIARERRDTKTIAINLLNSGAAADAAEAIVKAREMNFKTVFNDALTRAL